MNNKIMVHFVDMETGREAWAGPYSRVSFHIDHLMVAEKEDDTVDDMIEIANQVDAISWDYQDKLYSDVIITPAPAIE